MQLSHTLNANKNTVSCIGCGHSLGPTTSNWKISANLDEQYLKELGSPYTTGEQVMLRKFSCPACGALLDSELALPEDPFLEDIIYD